MIFLPNHIYHVFNRSNQGLRLFYNHENYLFFLRKLRTELLGYTDILAWTLMPNHYHLMLANGESDKCTRLNKQIGIIQRSFTRAINNQNKSTGSLFQIHAKAIQLDSVNSFENNYNQSSLIRMRACFNYIHLNAVRAGLAHSVEQYEFSSYRDYASLRTGTLCNMKKAEELLGFKRGQDFALFSNEIISSEILRELFGDK